MLKVLHISGARSWGGNEQQLIDLIHELKIQNVENIVLGVAGSPLEDECLKKYISFIPAKKNKLNKFANYRFLKRITEDLKPDVLHLHTSDSLTTFVISDLIYKIKIPSVFSKKGMGRSSSFLSKFKYNYRNISAIICVSKRVKEDFSEILTKKNKSKLTVIYDGVSPEILSQKTEFEIRCKDNIPNEKILIGNIANHTPAKDLHTLINTADHLINSLKEKNVAFAQIGEFSQITEQLKSEIKKRNLEDFIFLQGKQPKAYAYNKQFDIFLLTSEREGGPTSLLEAMLFDNPVISTNVGIVSEIIENGQNGFISNPKDYQSLAKNIQELMLDDNLKTRFSANKDLVLSKCNNKKTTTQTKLIYQKIIQNEDSITNFNI